MRLAVLLLLAIYVPLPLAHEANTGLDSLQEGLAFARQSWGFLRDYFACETAAVFVRTESPEFVLVDMPTCSTEKWNEAIRAMVAPREALNVWMLHCELGACERVGAIKEPTALIQSTSFIEIATTTVAVSSVPLLTATFTLSAIDRFAFSKRNLLTLMRRWSFVSVEPEEPYEAVDAADPLNRVIRREPNEPAIHTCPEPYARTCANAYWSTGFCLPTR
jgi:hypothetical protein